MNTKLRIKISIDILMTLALLIVSGYQLWGEAAHEWVGAGMFILFIAHNILNVNWYKSLFQSKYTAARIFQLIINLSLLTIMLMQMYSGIVLSRHVFDFLPIESGISLARRLHILGAYWGFLLISLHLGNHWNMVMGMLHKKMGIKNQSRSRAAICFILGLLIAGYGMFVFIKRDFITYLFLRSEFVFLDYSEPFYLFYIDYLALMGLCIFLSHYITKLCKTIHPRKGTTK